MKIPITLRSTLSNISWMVRGTAALLVAAALIFTIALTLRPNAQPPAADPAIQQAAPVARNPHVPISGTGSAYDGGTYGATHNPNIPVVGTGSAYDGGASGITRPAARTWPGVPVAGTGSAYNGRSYAVPRVAPQPVRDVPALHSTGSAYDGQ